MKKIFLFLILSTISFSAFSQKVDVKKNEILQDGQAIALIEKDGCTVITTSCSFYISSLDGESWITIVEETMYDPAKITSTNEDGKVRYLRFSFTGIDGVAEVANPALINTKPKDIAKIIVKAKLIKNGTLDENAIRNFINANGTRFSDRQKEINPKVIYIEEKKR